MRGLPAEHAGVQVGDLIVRVAGDPIKDVSDLRRALSDRAGETFAVEVVRDAIAELSQPGLGIRVQQQEPGPGHRLGLEDPVLVPGEELPRLAVALSLDRPADLLRQVPLRRLHRASLAPSAEPSQKSPGFSSTSMRGSAKQGPCGPSFTSVSRSPLGARP